MRMVVGALLPVLALTVALVAPAVYDDALAA
jgi:hypothetical protein